jgi:hypothetical protein
LLNLRSRFVIDQIGVFTHFDLRDLENLDLIELFYKIFSPEIILPKIHPAKFHVTSFQMCAPFTNEPLHITGLDRILSDKGKQLIDRMKEGSPRWFFLIENAIAQIIELDKILVMTPQQLFDGSWIWRLIS